MSIPSSKKLWITIIFIGAVLLLQSLAMELTTSSKEVQDLAEISNRRWRRVPADVGKVEVQDTDEDDDDNSASDEQKEKGPLPIASIKSRAIAMDRELCRELSRYHPHFPRCYDYCKKLNHWMGMCVQSSCHCYS